MPITILVADDDPDIRDVVHIYLRNEGYQVLEAENGQQAMDILQRQSIQLVILDIMMPELDGIKACLKIREQFNIPIIMLSAKGEDLDKIMGLSTGADDYVTKPFNPLELMARVKAQLRRLLNYSPSDAAQTDSRICIDDLVIDRDQHLVTVRQQAVSLTPIEFSILELLAASRGHVFSIDRIYQNVWKEPSAYYTENTVMVHIRNIREKIEANPRTPRYIKTVWGVGYKIEK